MARIILFLLTLGYISFSITYAQCVIYKHEDGRVLTTCDFYNSVARINPATHIQETYLGSPFLTYPVWQQGTIRLDAHGQELACELAYNLVTNDVLCRFSGDSTVKIVTPAVFTINGLEFVRQQNKLLNVDYRIYTTTLYDGQTKLLVSLTKEGGVYIPNATYKIDDTYKTNLTIRENYKSEVVTKGNYITKRNYYIRKEEAKPELISLSKSELLRILYDHAEEMEAKLPTKKLTPDDVIEALKYYDALSVADAVNKQPLSNDVQFKQVLHERITYPALARYNNAYGRVYAGFEVSDQGIVKNIVMLSPDNGGAGFVETVRGALEKLPHLNPALHGNYVLPVVFTYTNLAEKTGAHIPLNQLSPDRLDNRTLLEEFVVPLVVKKPLTDSREVWGYYK